MERKAKRARRMASFLRVVDGDFSKQLPIPSSFIVNFNGEIPSWVIIEIAGTRNCWRVDVENDGNGGLYFTAGWEIFMEANALEFGNFLVFEYNGQFIFQVTIYDKDGSEKTGGQISELNGYEDDDHLHQQHNLKINYAYEAILGDQSGEYAKQTQDVDRIQTKIVQPSNIQNDNLKDSCIGHEAVEQEGARDWFSRIKMEGVGWSSLLPDNLIQSSVENPHGAEHPPGHQHAEQCINGSTGSLNIACEQLDFAATTNYKTPEALRNTVGISPEFKQSRFSTTCTECTQGTYLHIPKKIAKEQNLFNKRRVVLCDQGGTQWELTVRVRQSDGRLLLTGKWAEFWRRNKISAGDTLIFEFVSDCTMNFKISKVSGEHAVK